MALQDGFIPMFMSSMKDAASGDSTTNKQPQMTKEESKAYWAAKDLAAINKGVNTPPVPDSTIKMAHTDWLKHIDNLGYQVVPKPKQ